MFSPDQIDGDQCESFEVLRFSTSLRLSIVVSGRLHGGREEHFDLPEIIDEHRRGGERPVDQSRSVDCRQGLQYGR